MVEYMMLKFMFVLQFPWAAMLTVGVYTF